MAAYMGEFVSKRMTEEQTPEANGRLLQYGREVSGGGGDKSWRTHVFQAGDPHFLKYLAAFLSEQYNSEVKRSV